MLVVKGDAVGLDLRGLQAEDIRGTVVCSSDKVKVLIDLRKARKIP
jgi:translation elongation factor EF-1alpha